MSKELFDKCQIKDRKLKHQFNLDWANFFAFWGIKIADKIIEWHFQYLRD